MQLTASMLKAEAADAAVRPGVGPLINLNKYRSECVLYSAGLPGAQRITYK